MMKEERLIGKESEYQIYFDYLLRLRNSGQTNMYGATSYLQDEFPELRYTPDKAREILLAWIKSFDRKEDRSC